MSLGNSLLIAFALSVTPFLAATAAYAQDAEIHQDAEKEVSPSTSPAPTPTPSPKNAEVSSDETRSPRSWFPFVAVRYNTASDLKFSNVSATSGSSSFSGNVDYQLDQALSGGAGVYYLPSGRLFGAQFAIFEEVARKFKSVSLTLGSNSDSESYTDGSTLQILTIEANAVVRAHQGFYFPFGLNFSIPTLQLSSSGSGEYKATPGLGAQLGAGFEFQDHFHAELLFRTTAMGLSASASNVNINFGTGYLSGVDLRFAYAF